MNIEYQRIKQVQVALSKTRNNDISTEDEVAIDPVCLAVL